MTTTTMNEELFLELLEKFMPELYSVHKFIKSTSQMFGYGEYETTILIKCHDYKNRRMELSASQGESKVKEKIDLK